MEIEGDEAANQMTTYITLYHVIKKEKKVRRQHDNLI